MYFLGEVMQSITPSWRRSFLGTSTPCQMLMLSKRTDSIGGWGPGGVKMKEDEIRWRRGRDSNPRYPLRYVRFRGGSFQPLTHLSGKQRTTDERRRTTSAGF